MITRIDWKLPVDYTKLTPYERKLVRDMYVAKQNKLCMYCGTSLYEKPPEHITKHQINWQLFPSNFLKYPIHLQHCHKSGMTEGAVHAYCNAVMWQYHQK